MPFKTNNTDRNNGPQGRALNFSMSESQNNSNNGSPILFVTAPPTLPSSSMLPKPKPPKVLQKSLIDVDLSDVSMDDEEQYTKKPDPLMDAFREIQKRKKMSLAKKVPECVNNGATYKVS